METTLQNDLSRRGFVKMLGAGLLIATFDSGAIGQSRGGGRRRGEGFGGRPSTIVARVHIARDGTITVMTGKVECGQGARAEITQAAAEDLHVAPDAIHLVMADTSLVPDDGMTAGSRTSPSTIPSVRQGTAAALNVLTTLAAQKWNVPPDQVHAENGTIAHTASKREISYGEIAADEAAIATFARVPGENVTVTPVKEWKVLGTPVARPNGRDLVTGGHQYPSDVIRPGTLHGKILRPPAYGATLQSIDLSPAKAMKDVVVTQDGAFVGVAAPTTFMAQQALDAIAATAKWDRTPQPSSKQLFEDLRQHARNVPTNAFAVEDPAKSLRATYKVAYVQHAPLEPRTATAEWADGKLTVWTGTQNPFGVKSELERALGVSGDAVRVIVPDFGGGFGGKHSGEAAIEAARLAKAAGKPVALRWTRKEEFTWAYFRPAGVIEVEAALDGNSKLTSWHFVNINSGPSSIETPYRVAHAKSQYVQSEPPLRAGSYRGLAATANTFARECAMDELAAMANADPLEFRLAHLDDSRLKGVLEAAAKHFGWSDRSAKKEPNVGVGIACGTEKGSYVATCAQVKIADGEIAVTHIAAAFDCGAILNPGNLLSQVQGAVTMALGPALREEIRFENGAIRNASFGEYRVPRFEDVPTIEVELINHPEIPSAGAGETPLISTAPAIANAAYRATGKRVRQMPMNVEHA